MAVYVAFFQPRAGIPFVAVHDSFWTHACFVDEMNKVSEPAPPWFCVLLLRIQTCPQICREQFVRLHKLPVMESLADHFDAKFRQLA